MAAVFEASNEVYGSAKVIRSLETDPDLETACRKRVAPPHAGKPRHASFGGREVASQRVHPEGVSSIERFTR